MARHLSVATVIEKNRVASSVAFVPLLAIKVKDPETGNIVETIRLAANSEGLVFQGETYTAASFKFTTKSSTGEVPELGVTIPDYTKIIQARMQAYGGGIGFEVVATIVNAGNLAQPAEIEENFEVIGADASDYVVSFKLGADNFLMRRFPYRRIFADRCLWRYKGAQCRYVGPLGTCDFTLNGTNGCSAHANSNRFGGFPGINSNA